MPHRVEVVTSDPVERSELPQWAGEGATLALRLQATGVLEWIAERLRIARIGGYAGIDAFLFLLLYFASNLRCGMAKFYMGCLGRTEKLASLGRRRSLASNSSMSRLLAGVDVETLRLVTHDLLRDGCEAASILGHPCVIHRDARCEAWHVFDYDGTRKVFRQRGLPQGEDLPAPERLSNRLAAPGYPGRKRGEVQAHRSALQHAGSGLWLDTRLAPGNGERREQLASALSAVTACCAAIDHPRHRAVVRGDGEFGNVPDLTAHRAAGVACVTRLNRLSLLDQADVQAHMARGTWHWVPDACSGPRRSALDLGCVTVLPGRDVVRDDGSPYEPIKVRVIVTRRPQEGEPDHGRIIDGWQYELFAALDLDAEAWPAPDVVTLYFGRTAQENRFAQEDRELVLDRILSYSLGGQELVCVVGMLVWNLSIVLGFQLNPPPVKQPALRAHQSEVDPRPVPAFDLDDAPATMQQAPSTEQVSTPMPAQEALRGALNELDWDHLLRRKDGWSHLPEVGLLECPAKHTAWLMSVSFAKKTGRPAAFFRFPGEVCKACPLRHECLSSARPDADKFVSLSLTPDEGIRLQPILERAKKERCRERSEKIMSKPTQSGRPRRSPKGTPMVVHFASPQCSPGQSMVEPAQLNPAAARRAFRRATSSLCVHIEIDGPVQLRQHPYLVVTDAQRQRRRATWTERVARYALPKTAAIRVRIEGGHLIGGLHGWRHEPAPMPA